MNIVSIFSGPFSVVGMAFIVAMESNLGSDPNDTTHAPHAARPNQTRQFRCSGVYASIYLVGVHLQKDLIHRLRKFVLQLTRCFRDCAKQEVAQVLQVAEI
ncbi:hypothetical protein BD769DRAFT_702059 [Suillus cothurnatus]|nr:hypothetical protein BD769DRAFT_702059 [Suillus cothurnatus]